MSETMQPVLLRQYKLLGAVIDAPWATRLDHRIVRHVIDRYFARHGNARASLRYLEVATGAKRNKIIPALRRIIKNGVISIVRQGIGTRPTEYDLNFDFGIKTPRGAQEGTSISGAVEGTSCGSSAGTSTASSGSPEGTESYLPSMSTDMLTVSRINGTPAVPSAPPVSGLEASTAASAVAPEGFEELWNAFPRKHQRAKARAAYNTLAPDHELHARLVASAIALAAHHTANGTEKKWWKHLHTWLAQECYLEDLPEPYEHPKDAAIARGPRRAAAGTKTLTAGKSGLSPKTPLGRHEVVIIGTAMPDHTLAPEQRMTFSYRIQGGVHDGREFSHTFNCLSKNDRQQDEGQSFYAEICKATGKFYPDDLTDLHDTPLLAIVSSMGRIEYDAL